MMRVLVTGATGFVGSHVVRALVASGHAVRALVRPRARRDAPGIVNAPVEWVIGDVLDPSSLAAAVDGCEAVMHIAAHLSFRAAEVALQREVNVQGTRNVLDAARTARVKRFVHTSSVAAVGRGAPGALADEQTRYDWPIGFHYNESKRDAEAVVRSARDLETVCLNPALVVGPDEVGRRALPLFRAVRAGLLPLVPPGGTTLCDVRDVAATHVAALERGRAGERYILGGPHLSFREGLSLVADEVGGRAPRAELPANAVRAGMLPLVALERLGVALPWSARYAGYLTARTYYSSEKAMRELGYQTRSAVESIRAAACFYRAAGAL
jgi:dihydroflavonol-4-reductase